MLYGYGWDEKHCRWCGCRYKAQKPLNRDGFCSNACKQAHYRAYKKYVIATPTQQKELKTKKEH